MYQTADHTHTETSFIQTHPNASVYSRDHSCLPVSQETQGFGCWSHQQPCGAKIQEKRSHHLHGGDRYVLFSGIGELVLSAAVVGLLNPWVRPQAFDGYHVRVVKVADLLNVHLLHQHGVILKGRRNRGTAVSRG